MFKPHIIFINRKTLVKTIELRICCWPSLSKSLKFTIIQCFKQYLHLHIAVDPLTIETDSETHILCGDVQSVKMATTTIIAGERFYQWLGWWLRSLLVSVCTGLWFYQQHLIQPSESSFPSSLSDSSADCQKYSP